MNISWKKYIDKTSSNPPRSFLVKAIPYLSSKNEALDLGSGALVDSKYLLEVGFTHVTAVDADEASKERAQDITDPSFTFVQTTFEEFNFKKENFDIINGQFAFSFIHRDSFERVMGDIKNALKHQGIITGQLFGDCDEWNTKDSTKSFVTKEEFNNLFSGFTILLFEEEETDKETALGTLKHWHTFHFIAQKQ